MKKTLKILKICAIVLASGVGLIILLLCGLTLYLTPERLTRIVNREASQYLQADVKCKHITYTLWSSFPRFNVSTDSIIIVSRTLRGSRPKSGARCRRTPIRWRAPAPSRGHQRGGYLSQPLCDP